MTENFYVYEHWRLDRDECFYVGKGKGGRAFSNKVRNRHWHAIVAKLGRIGSAMEVRMVHMGMAEAEALKLEVERIAFWRVAGVDIVNMTAGGDGLKNPTQAVRDRISASQKKRFEAPEARLRVSLQNRGRVTSEETKEKLRISSTGMRHSDETKSKLKIFAKKRGVSAACRAAQKAAVTGKKRAPFSDETRAKMSAASVAREARKRLERMEA